MFYDIFDVLLFCAVARHKIMLFFIYYLNIY